MYNVYYRDSKYKSKPSSNDDYITLLAFGNGSVNTSMKDKKPPMYRKMVYALKNAEGKGNLFVVSNDERFTSKVK